MVDLPDIQTIGEKLLSLDPDPVPRYRILRDVLHVSPQSAEYAAAETAARESKWVQMLAEEQHPDGSWGRFHTEDTKRNQKIPTTQFAVSRGFELGLQSGDALFESAIGYMTEVLRDHRRWSDSYETNVWFAPGVKLFTAATLATIDPDNPVLSQVWEPWYQVFCRTLQSGSYDKQAEQSASTEILGIDISDSYIAISAAPSLELFGARKHLLPAQNQHH